MCVGVRALEGSQRRERPLDDDKAGDDLDRCLVSGRRTRSDSVKPAERRLGVPLGTPPPRSRGPSPKRRVQGS